MPGLGCQAEGQRPEVGFIGCRAVKARMWPPAVVEVQVAADRSAGLADAVIGVQIHLLIFYAAPQPLDEDVVPPSPFAVHADCFARGIACDNIECPHFIVEWETIKDAKRPASRSAGGPISKTGRTTLASSYFMRLVAIRYESFTSMASRSSFVSD